VTMKEIKDFLIYFEDNILLLNDVFEQLETHSIPKEDILYRMSQSCDLNIIRQYGTDRGGFPGSMPWRFNSEMEENLLHEDIIYATTEQDIREAEDKPDRSSSFKKLSIIEQPILLIYDKRAFRKVADRQFAFINSQSKLDSLKAIIPIQKSKKVFGWFTNQEGLFYRELVNRVVNGIVVEIGIWEGLSLSYVCNICNKNENMVYAVDLWDGSRDNYNVEYKKILKTAYQLS